MGEQLSFDDVMAGLKAEQKEAEAEKPSRPLTPHPDFPGLMMKDTPATVVGLPYPNEDGTKRMDVARRLQIGDLLALVHEKDNKYDENAISVHEILNLDWPAAYEKGPRLGYLPKGLAALYAPIIGEGHMVFAVVDEKIEKSPGVYSVLKVKTGLYNPEAY